MVKKASLVILISGSGSNLQAIIDAVENDQLNAEIKTVISNQVSAKGLDRASKANITTHVIDHRSYHSRENFDHAMIQAIDMANPDLVILAGFMRILSRTFIEHYKDRLINIHPSLLPRYKGLNTHQLVLDNGDKVHGASVHYVGLELDSGPVVIQAEIPVLDSDTAQTLASRVLIEEHKIYPIAIKMHIDGRIRLEDGQLLLDDNPLTVPLLWKEGKLISHR
ncbi:MAG TPA: phosphoribosylglycinamide formyltransferase [Gammaproteobacteria bacterium]|nr:phosphoribosylglycinamide formyltransferase [Gammaproteobacteria bacterium]